MDFFEAQEFFKQQYPGKEIGYSFDEMCHRCYELIVTNGAPNVVHHVTHTKVKVSVEGMEPFYCPIKPHRENYTWPVMKQFINNKLDVFIHENDINELKDNVGKPEYDDKMNTLVSYSGLTKEQIEKKLI